MKEYWTAVAEYVRIVSYRKSATGILSKAERDLLLEFERIAKSKCERLRRAVKPYSRDLATESAADVPKTGFRVEQRRTLRYLVIPFLDNGTTRS